jgi:hemerythrin-like domain-containing protein
MDAMDILIKEHSYIKKVLNAVKKDCEQLAEGKEIDAKFYWSTLDFVRNYADTYHHLKEEKDLFRLLGEADVKLKDGPVRGMLLEHDMGRFYMKMLQENLELYENGNKTRKAYIIANALSYAVMLEEHINKEDNVLYAMAKRVLSKEVQEKLLEQFIELEDNEENRKIRQKYIEFANKF